MDEKLMLKIAVFISIIGITMLFVISKFITIEPVNIKNIDETSIGKTVLVKGTVTKTYASNKTSSLFVDNSTIPMTIFSRVDIKKGQNALITGRVDEYNDGIQIVVDKIEII